MTDNAAAQKPQLPYKPQSAVPSPELLERIDRQLGFFDAVLSDVQMAAWRRALMRRNQPDEKVFPLVGVVSSMTEETRDQLLCRMDPLYFINEFCQIYDNTTLTWIPFKVWDAQIKLLYAFETQQFVIILKARQEGLTWESLAWGLYTTQYRPIASVLLFSLSDREAMALLSQERFIGMYERLPDNIKATTIDRSNAHFLRFANSSNVAALPSTRGDSYTATLVVVDEADLIPNLP